MASSPPGEKATSALSSLTYDLVNKLYVPAAYPSDEPSHHNIIKTEAGTLAPPLRTLPRERSPSTRRDRSKSPENLDRIYRTREGASSQLSQNGRDRVTALSNLAYRPYNQRTMIANAAENSALWSPPSSSTADYGGSGAWSQARSEKALGPEEGDKDEGEEAGAEEHAADADEVDDDEKAGEAAKEAGEEEEAAEEEGRTAISGIQTGLHTLLIRDLNRDEELIRQAEATFVDAAWLDQYPFLDMWGMYGGEDEAWDAEEKEEEKEEEEEGKEEGKDEEHAEGVDEEEVEE